MNKRIELNIGQSISIICIEDTDSKGCRECILNGTPFCNTVKCSSQNRVDKKNVHFELVKQ